MKSEHVTTLALKPGDWVEVRSEQEILDTLDTRCELDNLPFMPEMLQFCNHRYKVGSRADKTCDSIDNMGALRMHDTVHLLGLRCDGSEHDGCEAECQLFWKEAWLRRAKPTSATDAAANKAPPKTALERLRGATQGEVHDENEDSVPRYYCQATELKRAASPLPWWDLRQYVRDVRTGNATITDLFRAGMLSIFRKLMSIGVGYTYLLRTYNWIQDRLGGLHYPFRQGTCNGKTPTADLGLKEGDEVRIRPYEDILDTLNENNKNRGLWFDAGMVHYCNQSHRVKKRVNKIINEKTGVMMQLPNSCLILEDVFCVGRFTTERQFCPRKTPLYWREIWLERTLPDVKPN